MENVRATPGEGPETPSFWSPAFPTHTKAPRRCSAEGLVRGAADYSARMNTLRFCEVIVVVVFSAAKTQPAPGVAAAR